MALVPYRNKLDSSVLECISVLNFQLKIDKYLKSRGFSVF